VIIDSRANIVAESITQSANTADTIRLTPQSSKGPQRKYPDLDWDFNLGVKGDALRVRMR
jgi:hypothetical protein